MTVPAEAHPLCRFVFAEAKRQRCRYEDFEFETGVLKGTVKEWRKRGKLPRITNLAAALTYLGWEIQAVPFANSVPDALRRDLEAALEKHGAAIPALGFLPDVPTLAH
jgi:hypothetical protein